MMRTSPVSPSRARRWLLGLLACGTLGAADAAQDNGPVGVVVSDIEYWITGIDMADLVKRGQEWLDLNTNGVPADVNDQGWPIEPASTRVIIGTYQRFERVRATPDDVLVLRYSEGSPQAGVKTDADAYGYGVVEVSASTDAATGIVTKEYTVTGLQGHVSVRINALNSIDAAGDGSAFDPQVQLWVDKAHMRAFDQDREQVFYDVFLDKLRSIRPAHVRLGWSRPNSASGTLLAGSGGISRYAWDPLARPRIGLDHANWSGNEAAPWEIFAWVANQAQTDLWVEIPFVWYAANDSVTMAKAKAYVQEMASVIRDELDPGRKCLVEFSNEMWNSNYSTYQVIDAFDGPFDQSKPVRFVVDAFTWWNEVWSDARVEYLAMGYAGDSRYAEAIADGLKGLGLLHAVGCAAYYFPTFEDQAEWGEDDPTACANLDSNAPSELELVGSLKTMIDNNVPFDATGAVPGLTHALRFHGDLANSLSAELGRPIHLYTYEGGPSLKSNCSGLQQLYEDFQHDSMYSFWVLAYELLRFVDGLGVGPDKVQPPLTKLVDRFTFNGFIKPPDSTNGDFLMKTDLWAGDAGIAVVDPTPQWKYLAVLLFNYLH